ncbi:MAG TPA: SRPBCC family protein [Candidatus Limnocylindria bacterium]
MTRIEATAHSPLSPAQLFDLLADPRGCMTWHNHPEKDRPQGTDAPPGPALAGAEYWTRGLCGKIPWRTRTTVTAAEASRQYATETETIFSHPRVPTVRANERFVLEANGVGCLVRYKTEVFQDVADLSWLARAYVAVANRLAVGRSLRNNFHHVMKAAESEAARASSPRT